MTEKELNSLFFHNYEGLRDTKESLLKMLNKYRGILSSHTIDYLNSLIGLEFSVIKDHISNEDRDALSELEIYRKIAIYNIYKRGIDIIEKSGFDISILEYSTYKDFGLSIRAKGVEVFEFTFGEIRRYDSKVPNNYKNMKIGDIALFRVMESLENRAAEIERVMSKLERLYAEGEERCARKELDPYRGIPAIYVPVGTGEYEWDLDHSRTVNEYEKLFKELEGKQKLSDEDRVRIEVTTQINDLLLADYGLSLESFEEDDSRCFSLDAETHSSKLHKTRVKRMPGITIKNNIEYI